MPALLNQGRPSSRKTSSSGYHPRGPPTRRTSLGRLAILPDDALVDCLMPYHLGVDGILILRRVSAFVVRKDLVLNQSDTTPGQQVSL